MHASTFRLFVYGTLKRGYCRHYALGSARFLGVCSSAKHYELLDLGDYPGLVHAPGSGRSILGELYEVPTSARAKLDEVEGAPELFALAEIHLADRGEACASPSEPVFAYYYQPVVTHPKLVLADCWK